MNAKEYPQHYYYYCLKKILTFSRWPPVHQGECHLYRLYTYKGWE